VNGNKMGVKADFKLLKEKKIGKELTLKISQNLMSGRIFVEFNSTNPKLTLQKNFQNTIEGKYKSEEFSKSIKSLEQFKEYFGIK
jgi:hypothetical protein